MDAPVPEGTLIGNRWRVAGMLGEGGFGRVFEALDESDISLGRAAVKLLHPNISPQERNAFLGEVKKIAGLRHPNLVGYLDSGQQTVNDEIHPYLVTELCVGSLQDHIRQKEGYKLDAAEALTVLADVSAGLDHLHSRSMIHRDIKPGNVLYAQGNWKLADFGLMRDLTATGTYHRSSQLVGTPMFMAPELFSTMTATAPSDVYALGVLAHMIGTGRPLHSGTGPALVHQITNNPPEIDPELHPGLRELIARSTELDPANRLSARQFKELAAAHRSEAVGSTRAVLDAPPPVVVPSASAPGEQSLAAYPPPAAAEARSADPTTAAPPPLVAQPSADSQPVAPPSIGAQPPAHSQPGAPATTSLHAAGSHDAGQVGAGSVSGYLDSSQADTSQAATNQAVTAQVGSPTATHVQPPDALPGTGAGAPGGNGASGGGHGGRGRSPLLPALVIVSVVALAALGALAFVVLSDSVDSPTEAGSDSTTATDTEGATGDEAADGDTEGEAATGGEDEGGTDGGATTEGQSGQVDAAPTVETQEVDAAGGGSIDLSSPVTVEDGIAVALDQRAYTFSASAGDRVSAEVLSMNGECTVSNRWDMEISVRDSSGQLVGELIDNPSCGDGYGPWTLEADGQYSFVASGGEGTSTRPATGTYTLKFGKLSLLDTPVDLAAPVEIEGGIDVARDAQLFSFDAAAGQRVSVQINAINGECTVSNRWDMEITIVDDGGTAVGELYDGLSCNDAIGPWVLPTAGRYSLVVAGGEGTSTRPSTGTYRLTLAGLQG